MCLVYLLVKSVAHKPYRVDATFGAACGEARARVGDIIEEAGGAAASVPVIAAGHLLAPHVAASAAERRLAKLVHQIQAERASASVAEGSSLGHLLAEGAVVLEAKRRDSIAQISLSLHKPLLPYIVH